MRAAVQADLSAGLQAQGVDVCTRERAQAVRAPVGRVDMQLAPGPVVAISVAMASAPETRSRDAHGDGKRRRNVDLSTVPRDSQGLVLALAADELLRSLGLLPLSSTNATQDPTQPSPQVEEPPAAPPEKADPLPGPQASAQKGPTAPHLRFAVNGSLEHHGAGVTQAGADAVAALFPTAHVGLEAALSVREGFRRQSDRGTLGLRALGGRASLLIAPTGRDHPTTLVARLGVAVLTADLRGHPNEGALATREQGLDVHGILAVGLRQQLVPPLELAIDAGLGGPLLAITLADDGRDVAGTGGVQLRCSLGLGVRL
ncbi:MAG: hypothetical protein OXU20_34635 [Myxococcales bacterium]|nr:hypothetical protein [Myxococcales bacterium]